MQQIVILGGGAAGLALDRIDAPCALGHDARAGRRLRRIATVGKQSTHSTFRRIQDSRTP